MIEGESPFAPPSRDRAPPVTHSVRPAWPRWLGVPLLLIGALILVIAFFGAFSAIAGAATVGAPHGWRRALAENMTPFGLLLYGGIPIVWAGVQSLRRRPRATVAVVVLWALGSVLAFAGLGTASVLLRPGDRAPPVERHR